LSQKSYVCAVAWNDVENAVLLHFQLHASTAFSWLMNAHLN